MLEESAAALDAGLGSHLLMFCLCQLQAADVTIIKGMCLSTPKQGMYRV
jgi:hypothetical protein